MIGDVAAGQWADPFTRDPSTTRPVAITRRSIPLGTSGQLCRLRLRSGSALLRRKRKNAFSPWLSRLLTLIAARQWVQPRKHCGRRARIMSVNVVEIRVCLRWPRVMRLRWKIG